MLVLTLKPGETCNIGESVKFFIAKGGGNFKVCFDAPKSVRIVRENARNKDAVPRKITCSRCWAELEIESGKSIEQTADAECWYVSENHNLCYERCAALNEKEMEPEEWDYVREQVYDAERMDYAPC